MAVFPMLEFEPGFHSSAVPSSGFEGTEVLAVHHGVAEAVAGQALAGAVADVGRPGNGLGAEGDSFHAKCPPM